MILDIWYLDQWNVKIWSQIRKWKPVYRYLDGQAENKLF